MLVADGKKGERACGGKHVDADGGRVFQVCPPHVNDRGLKRILASVRDFSTGTVCFSIPGSTMENRARMDFILVCLETLVCLQKGFRPAIREQDFRECV